jgi:nucleolar MIF4G domain-containing protein 1
LENGGFANLIIAHVLLSHSYPRARWLASYCKQVFTCCFSVFGTSAKNRRWGSIFRPHLRIFSAKKFRIVVRRSVLRHSIMPRSSGPRTGLKLPGQLQHELGITTQSSKVKKGGHGRPQGRKDRRRAEREEKKFVRVGRGHVTAQTKDKRALTDYGNDGTSSESDASPRPPPPKLKQNPSPSEQHVLTTKPKLKSILKKTVQPPLSSPSMSPETDASRSPSPGLVLDRSSKAFLDRAAQDDAEISALEKKLGLKSKKLPKSFDDDGLGDLLEGLDSGVESKKRKRGETEWLQRKRRMAEVEDEESGEAEDMSDMDVTDGGLSEEGGNDHNDAIEDVDESDPEIEDFEDFGSEEEVESTLTPVRQRENPYIAPVAANSSTAKYIPPSRRKPSDVENEALQRLRRRIQGHLNKLSEANIVTILGEIEKLYQSHARQDVTSTLTDLLLGLFCDRSALQSTFVILHAAFIAAAYKIIGTDFGAEIVSKLVERLDELYATFDSSSGKEAVNLISLISHLYTFHVIGSRLVFDYVRMLLEELSEARAELLLRVVRDVGPQLRQDDPSSLKDMIRIMQNSAAKLEANGQETSVRTKFMIETITDLKNNKIKAAASVNGVAIEHITRMRKVLGTLNTRNVRASEPLRIGRQDIKDTERRGKWWLVGASWKGNADDNAHGSNEIGEEFSTRDAGLVDPQEADLLALAREYRMNTSVRRSIFIAVMSASDYQDAHLRLLKLRLKRSQEQEIPKVLLRCAGAETMYNPYYTLIAKKLCADKRMKMAFQFSLWDFFKRMGEKGDMEESDDDDDETQAVELTEVVNLAKMYAGLVADGALSLTVLKTLNLAYLKDQAHTFVELLLVMTILQSQEGVSDVHDETVLRAIFGKAGNAPQLLSGLQFFLKKAVAQSDLASSQKERGTLKWGSKVARDTLKMLRLPESVAQAA